MFCKNFIFIHLPQEDSSFCRNKTNPIAVREFFKRNFSRDEVLILSVFAAVTTFTRLLHNKISNIGISDGERVCIAMDQLVTDRY